MPNRNSGGILKTQICQMDICVLEISKWSSGLHEASALLTDLIVLFLRFQTKIAVTCWYTLSKGNIVMFKR